MAIEIDYDRLIREARSVLAEAEAAGATTEEEHQALAALEDKWQEALDALCQVARDLNSLDGLTRQGLRNRLGHLANGQGFGGMY
jgi:ABC-type transporter Mla subunit MlaD